MKKSRATEPLAVVTACDDAFVPGLAALLNSLERHEPDRTIHLLDCGITASHRERLRSRFARLEVVPLEVPPELVLPSVGSLATYARLFIGDLFGSLGRALYLDADTILLSTLAELESWRIGPPNVVAACLEPYTPNFRSDNGPPDFARLNFSGAEPYFNAGVLLIDIAAWNAAEVKERSLAYLRRSDIRIALFDQEALNVVLAGCWDRLEPEWNVSRYWLRAERRKSRPQILHQARIVHFLSAEKPWRCPEAIHPWMLAHYRKYIAGIPPELLPAGAVAVGPQAAGRK